MVFGNIYLIELANDRERFFKIGISVHRYCRFYQLMKFGYSAKIVCMVMGIDYIKALDIEQRLKSLFDPYLPLVKFGGYTECFTEVDISDFKNEFCDVSFKEVVEDLEISWR